MIEGERTVEVGGWLWDAWCRQNGAESRGHQPHGWLVARDVPSTGSAALENRGS